jgi:hypothetical protein
MGKSCTVIKGLDAEEADTFIESRLAVMELPSEAFPAELREEVIDVCEGSPLYMEDLLRFCKFLPPRKAIDTWGSKSGEKVRQYALVREIEMLSAEAKDVLGLCSLLEGSVSVLELQRVLGKSEETVIEAVDELRKMYLVPAPEIIEGVPRFSVNRNLALLMRSALKESPQKELELKNAIRAIFGRGFGRELDREVREYCRQSRVLAKASRVEEAESTLRTGLERYPNHPRLLGMLGWVSTSTGHPAVLPMLEASGNAVRNSSRRIGICTSTGRRWSWMSRSGGEPLRSRSWEQSSAAPKTLRTGGSSVMRAAQGARTDRRANRVETWIALVRNSTWRTTSWAGPYDWPTRRAREHLTFLAPIDLG